MVYLNGNFLKQEEARIDPADRGLLLADGIFETMKVYQGKAFYLDKHWERLKKSAKYLDIKIPISYENLVDIINSLLCKNNLLQTNASIRLTLTRGVGPRGLLPPLDAKPTLLLAAFTAPLMGATPASVYVVNIRKNEFSPLCNIKSLNYLDNILARREAVKQQATEAILLNSKGNIAEASSANIFIITDNGSIITPSLSEGALPGITRYIVMNLAEKLNIPLAETSVSVDEFNHSKGMFLTNSLIGIHSIDSVNNKKIMGPIEAGVIKKLQIEYGLLITDFIKKNKGN